MENTVSRIERDDKRTVVLLGGHENAVACARRFTRAGITTVAVNEKSSPVFDSRGVIPIVVDGRDFVRAVTEWLQGEGLAWEGSVVIPLSDHALLGIAEALDASRDNYRFAVVDFDVARSMLDKQAATDLAREAGIATPTQWIPPKEGSIPFLQDLTYPLIMKPRRTTELLQLSGMKHIRVDMESELDQHLRSCEASRADSCSMNSSRAEMTFCRATTLSDHLLARHCSSSRSVSTAVTRRIRVARHFTRWSTFQRPPERGGLSSTTWESSGLRTLSSSVVSVLASSS